MFGTFEAERSDVKLVYGLVDQPQFWNPVQHQVRMVSYTFSICFVKMKQLPPQPPLPSHEKRGHVVGFVFPFHAPDQHHCHHQHQKASALSSITVSINTEQHQHQRASVPKQHHHHHDQHHIVHHSIHVFHLLWCWSFLWRCHSIAIFSGIGWKGTPVKDDVMLMTMMMVLMMMMMMMMKIIIMIMVIGMITTCLPSPQVQGLPADETQFAPFVAPHSCSHNRHCHCCHHHHLQHYQNHYHNH